MGLEANEWQLQQGNFFVGAIKANQKAKDVKDNNHTDEADGNLAYDH